MRASAFIPGLFPPLIESQNVFVDGGVDNNTRVDIMRRKEDIGTVIAMDVSAPVSVETAPSPSVEVNRSACLPARAYPDYHSRGFPVVSSPCVLGSRCTVSLNGQLRRTSHTVSLFF